MSRRPLGDLLVARGLATTAQIEQALARQRNAADRPRLGRILVDDGVLDEAQLAESLAINHGLPSANLDLLTIAPEVARALPRPVAERYVMTPIALDEHHMTVAVSDPVDVVALDELRARLPKLVRIVVSPADQIQQGVDLVQSGVTTPDEVLRSVVTDQAAPIDADMDSPSP